MRVIAGIARSMPLHTPEGTDTRPTQDRIKETLFNIIQGDVPDSVFIDCFAGSGGIGIEALSRGARKAYFIDFGKTPVACIQHNLAFTKLDNRAIVLKGDVLPALAGIHEEHVDIIFADPPYGKGLERGTLEQLSHMKYCDEDTLIIVESLLEEDFSYTDDLGFQVIREKKYKNNKHVFLRKQASKESS